MHPNIDFIICLDDSEADLFYNSYVLKQMNIASDVLDFIEIEDALECLREINETKDNFTGVFLIDLNMPIYNGIEVLENHHKLFESLSAKGLRVILLTTSNYKKDIDLATKNPFITNVIEKPLNQENITFMHKTIISQLID
jgi:CheY-like chemotaxis protein